MRLAILRSSNERHPRRNVINWFQFAKALAQVKLTKCTRRRAYICPVTRAITPPRLANWALYPSEVWIFLAFTHNGEIRNSDLMTFWAFNLFIARHQVEPPFGSVGQFSSSQSCWRWAI